MYLLSFYLALISRGFYLHSDSIALLWLYYRLTFVAVLAKVKQIFFLSRTLIYDIAVLGLVSINPNFVVILPVD